VIVAPDFEAHALMLRPARSRLVTNVDIVRALGWCNLTKTKSFRV